MPALYPAVNCEVLVFFLELTASFASRVVSKNGESDSYTEQSDS